MLNQPISNGGRELSRKERRLAKKQARKKPQVISNDYALVAQLKKAEEAERSGQLELAATLYADLIDLRKDAAVAQFNAANFFQRTQRPDIAFAGFKNAVTLEPANADYWERFGQHLSVAGQNEATVIAYQHACALKPIDHEGFLTLANAHAINGDPQQALAAAEIAVNLLPDYAAGHYRRGVFLGALGRFEESHLALYKALELDPGLHEIYYRLMRTGAKIDNADEVLKKLKTTLASARLEGDELTDLFFAIAKLEEQLENHDGAFEHYLLANKTIFDRNLCNVNAVAKMFEVYSKGYDRKTFEKLSSAGHASNVPIFIVGMPRSGTTLVEQVIASHSKASGAGELNKIYQLSNSLIAESHNKSEFPESFADFDPDSLRRAGEEYLSFLKRQVPDEPARITDKMPPNFIHLGLIKTLFPNAAIIHCRRTALDTCVSCFTTHFGNLEMMGYSYNLEILGRYYRGYERLMAHWHGVLPGQILDVDYENLIDNPQAVCRNIIEHIGLDWEDQCLEFHTNKRSVQTASAWQVRQPIYNSSVGRWRRYEKHLGPLQLALKDG